LKRKRKIGREEDNSKENIQKVRMKRKSIETRERQTDGWMDEMKRDGKK
jgi:type II secretory pathway component HofQ